MLGILVITAVLFFDLKILVILEKIDWSLV